jgi:predicted ArsR family transcriptional regulator
VSRENDVAAQEAVQNGATTAAEVAEATGMSNYQARQALTHLETEGKVKADGKAGDGHSANKFKPTN